MDAWLISWMDAGHNFRDRIVAVLPEWYEAGDVQKVAEALFYVGTLTIGEAIQFRSGRKPSPE
ncbi:MAG: hypothetical protein LC667_16210, partial [Thioalkalivibrio sp.]|nr:hypothetical protein [Thioalkalivibrio sp.]